MLDEKMAATELNGGSYRERAKMDPIFALKLENRLYLLKEVAVSAESLAPGLDRYSATFGRRINVQQCIAFLLLLFY